MKAKVLAALFLFRPNEACMTHIAHDAVANGKQAFWFDQLHPASLRQSTGRKVKAGLYA
jgi:hypothetical protein